MRKPIYFIKRLFHRNTALYQFLYGLATFNLDYLHQILGREHYPSRFGGMWTDRDDFQDILTAKTNKQGLSSELQSHLLQWRQDGYIVLKRAIDPKLIDNYLEEIEQLKKAVPSPLLITAASIEEPAPYTEERERAEHSVRTVDDYFYSEASRQVLMNKPVMDFLQLVFEKPATLTQSLSFIHGSQQAIHQDTAFVRMNSPMKLAAIWVALEDIQAGSGELLYYPGSHRWEGFLFSGRFKHWDEERDGLQQLEEWHQWITDEAVNRDCKAISFLPRKGDVLIWHAGLAHGGAPILQLEATRRSLVGHYCPAGVRPLYHYYKPGQRKRHTWRQYQYCSSYYRER